MDIPGRKVYFDLKLPLGDRTATVALTDHFLTDDVDLGTTRYPHSHPGWELQLCTRGEGVIQTEHASFPFREGDVALISPNLPHSILPRPGGEPSGRVTFLFFLSHKTRGRQKEDSGELSRVADALEALPPVLVIPEADGLRRSLGELREEVQLRRLAYMDKLQAAFLALFIDLARAAADFPPPSRPPRPTDVDENRAQYIEDYFNRSFASGCSRRELAQRLYLSESQLERILKRLYGRPFRELLLELRMETAEHLLRTTTLPLSEIAAQVGYSTVNAFHYAYRRRYGETPAKRRKRRPGEDKN